MCFRDSNIMLQKIKLIVLLFCSVMFFRCENWQKQHLLDVDKMYVLGHRCSGAGLVYDSLIENTIPSLKYALSVYDGVEIDIQMSKNGTLWMYHDGIIDQYHSNSNKICIPNLKDSELEKVKFYIGDKESKLYKLKEAFEILSLKENRNKIISLDVKGYFPSKCFKNNNADKEYLEKLSLAIVDLSDKYSISNQLIVETDYKICLDVIKRNSSGIRTHFLAHNNFLKATEIVENKGYDGVSINLNIDKLSKYSIQNVKNKGIDVQLWTIYNSKDFNKALNFNPSTIQVTNPKSIKNKRNAHE